MLAAALGVVHRVRRIDEAGGVQLHLTPLSSESHRETGTGEIYKALCLLSERRKCQNFGSKLQETLLLPQISEEF